MFLVQLISTFPGYGIIYQYSTDTQNGDIVILHASCITRVGIILLGVHTFPEILLWQVIYRFLNKIVVLYTRSFFCSVGIVGYLPVGCKGLGTRIHTEQHMITYIHTHSVILFLFGVTIYLCLF